MTRSHHGALVYPANTPGSQPGDERFEPATRYAGTRKVGRDWQGSRFENGRRASGPQGFESSTFRVAQQNKPREHVRSCTGLLTRETGFESLTRYRSDVVQRRRRLIVDQVIGVRIPASELRARSSTEEHLLCKQKRVGSSPTGSTQGTRIVGSGEERRLVTPEVTGSKPVRSAQRTGLRNSVDRVPVYDTGCAGSTPAGGTHARPARLAHQKSAALTQRRREGQHLGRALWL